MNEITSIEQISKLLMAGETHWKQYGEVSTNTKDDLVLFNYTDKAQHDGRWNFFERVSRGLIINRRTGEIVARPFDKFFNWLEGGRVSFGHIVTVTAKVDGSLAICFRENGQWSAATRGNFYSEQAIWATELLNHNYRMQSVPDELTILAEAVYPKNRIVVDYGDRNELVLLAARNRFTGEYLPYFPDLIALADTIGMTLTTYRSFNNVLSIIENTGALPANEEGYVVEFSDGERFKFKGDRYLELAKLINGISFRSTLRALHNNTFKYLMEHLPEEYHGTVEAWADKIEARFRSIRLNAAWAFGEIPDGTRKEQAQRIMKDFADLSPLVFALLDHKDITPLIWKMMEKTNEDEF